MAVTTIPTPRNNSNVTFAGSFKRENVPITPEQGARLRAGESPTVVLGAAIAPSVVPPLRTVTTSSTRTTATPPTPPSPLELAKAAHPDAPFRTEQLDPSGLSRTPGGGWMYGGPQPQVIPLPWRDPTVVGPIVPLPVTSQPIPATITPSVGGRQDIPITDEQEQRLRAGEDIGTVLGPGILPQVPPTPPLPPGGGREDIPITDEQEQRLRAGEDIGTVLGTDETPGSVGPPTVTPLNQLNNPPWMPLDSAIIPDNMGHVITDAALMKLLEPQVPENAWESHTMRLGWESTLVTQEAGSAPPDDQGLSDVKSLYGLPGFEDSYREFTERTGLDAATGEPLSGEMSVEQHLDNVFARFAGPGSQKWGDYEQKWGVQAGTSAANPATPIVPDPVSVPEGGSVKIISEEFVETETETETGIDPFAPLGGGVLDTNMSKMQAEAMGKTPNQLGLSQAMARGSALLRGPDSFAWKYYWKWWGDPMDYSGSGSFGPRRGIF